jgi:hypothetical protein
VSSPKSRKLLLLTGGIVLLLTLTGFLGYKFLKSAFAIIDESGQNVAQVDWLPKEATDITYVRRGDLFWLCVYECTMPRAAFERFAKENSWAIKESRNVHVGPFRSILKLPPIRQNSPQEELSPEALYYEERQQNGGGITVVYDLETQRLFVAESSN